jgi:hypothetical protein
MKRLMVILIITLAAGTASAAAQSVDGPTLTIGGGGGMAFPLHGDLQFDAPTWQVSTRLHVAEYAWIEAAYAEWRHSTAEVRSNQPITGPNGPLGRIDRITQQTRWTNRTLGLNAVVGARPGNLALWAGGGPGYMDLGSRFRQTETGCQGNVTCTDFERSHNAGVFTVQGTGGIDVTVTRRIVVYGQ